MYEYLGIRGLLVAVYFSILIAIVRSFGKHTMVRSIHNYRLHLDTQDRGLSRTLFLFGKREIDHYLMLQSILNPGMNILDIVANIGTTATRSKRSSRFSRSVVERDERVPVARVIP